MVVKTLCLAPPEFAYLPGLVSRDPCRVRLADAIRLWAPGAALDLGDDGVTAEEQAARAATHDGALLTVGTPADTPGLDVLEEHLARLGLCFARRILESAPGHAAAAVFVCDEERDADWRCRLVEHVSKHGAHARLAFPPSEPRRDRGSWGACLGLGRPRGAGVLEDATRIVAPARIPEVQVIIDLYELGIHPLLEMYAGNGLWDRNDELLVNIVP
jgi:hypothetical protein